MSVKEKIQPLKVLGPVAKVVAAGIGAGVLGGVSITLRHHRELTHRSVTLHPLLQDAIDFEQRTLTVEPRIWAAVHRIHHQMADATLAPFYRIARAVNWIRDNSEETRGVVVPETFPFLDPYVDRFKFEDVMEIGNMAIELMKERMGVQYRAPEKYTPRQLKTLLNPTEPRYWYSIREHRGDEYTQEELADILLGDPHSPVRVAPPDLNGVRFILAHTTGLYKMTADLFKAHPQLMPKDLQTEDGQVKKYGNFDLALGFAIPSMAVLIARGRLGPKDVLTAAVAGSAINGMRIGFLIFGGKLVNSLGHAGTMNKGEVARVIRSQEYTPKLNPDGTVATDTSDNSWLGRFFSRMTFDEVGGQKEHHEDTGKIAYTSKKGFKAWMEAPWGSLVSALARSKYFPLINPGDNFNLKVGEIRPDQPHPAVEIIQRLRAEQLAAR